MADHGDIAGGVQHRCMGGRAEATSAQPAMAEDQHPQMTYQGGLYVAPLTLKPGLWNIHLTATAWDGTQFRQRLDHYHGSRVK